MQEVQKFPEIARCKWNQWDTNKLYYNYMVNEASMADIFGSVAYKSWAEEVTNIYKNKEVAEVAIVKTLTLHHGDKVLRDMLNAAKQVSETKEVASALEIAQLKYWVKASKSPVDVFKWLKLNDVEGDKVNIFERATMKTWFEYVTEVDEKNARKIIYEVLKEQYGIKTLKPIIASVNPSVVQNGMYAKLKEMFAMNNTL